jgi:YegS/Rv2252/BmrU family lipid kinase
MHQEYVKDWLSGWIVIVNSNAGNRRAEKDWPVIRKILGTSGFDFRTFFTEGRGDAISIAGKQAGKGFSKIIVVGGDGTLNEAVNGIFSSGNESADDVIVGMVPVGTGNDWGRMYGIPGKYEEAVGLLKAGELFTQDVAWVRFRDKGQEVVRYIVNNAGIGYDARVARETNRLKEQGRAGTIAYLYKLVSGLFKYKYKQIRMEIDGKLAFEGPFFTLTLGVCRFNGGGMMQLPYAVPDDGMIDVTVIHAVRKDIIIRNLYKVYNGSHARLPIVDTYRGKEVKLTGLGQEIPELETDGESLGGGPFTFGIVPNALKVIVNKDWKVTSGKSGRASGEAI